MIVVDVHEPDKIKQKLRCRVESLPAGDYVVFGQRGTVIIERKEVNDFVSSVRDDRLWQQLESIKAVAENEGFRPLLLIEGEPWKVFRFRKVRLPQWFGMLQAVTVGYGIPVMFTRDEDQTVLFIQQLERRLGKTDHVRSITVKKEGRTPVEQAEDMLCAVDLIGRKKAREILSRYSIREIVNNPGLLYNVKGVGEKVVSNFVSVVNAKYGNDRNLRDPRDG